MIGDFQCIAKSDNVFWFTIGKLYSGIYPSDFPGMIKIFKADDGYPAYASSELFVRISYNAV